MGAKRASRNSARSEARLRRALAEVETARQQLAASAEILKVISSSRSDAQPVFDAIARNAVSLCEGLFANVFQYDGERLHWASSEHYAVAAVEILRRTYPMRPDPSQVSGRVILTGSTVRLEDALADPVYDRRFPAAGAWRRMLGVPMLRDGSPIGAIVVGWSEAGPISEHHEALLRSFADQAVIAIENVRLFNALEARTQALARSVRSLTALSEVGQAIGATLDLEAVLKTVVSRSVQLTGLDAGEIFEFDEALQEFHLRAAENLDGNIVEALRRMPLRKGEGAIGGSGVTGRPVEVPEILDPAYRSPIRELLVDSGHRALLVVPLMREGHLHGALAVNRKAPGPFGSDTTELLQTFAAQSTLAIQNARLFREIAEKSRQLEIVSRHKSEFLASMSHELRTPLNAIIGFSEVLHEHLFGPLTEKQDEYVNDIHTSGQHLLSLVNDILDLSKIEAGKMELELSQFDLPTALQTGLTLVGERAHRHGVRLALEIDPALGQIRADERKFKQIMLNLLSNAVKFTPEGGSVAVRARPSGAVVEVSVIDTGCGIAPEDQGAVFEEFKQVGRDAARKAEGTGLGLPLTKRLVELHGGTLRLESAPGEGSTFSFTLPLDRCADRR